MACEQEGSKQLQKEFAGYESARLQAAVAELAPHLSELAMHRFGNYLVSSMCAQQAAQPAIVSALTGRVAALMQHAQGSRVVQAALEALPTSDVARLAGELKGRVAEVAVNTHGSWGVCAAFKHGGASASFIVDEATAAIAHLATHQNGSRVVQRVLPEAASRGMDVSGATRALAAMEQGALASLASDQYANYVVQIGLRLSPVGSPLVDLLTPSLRALSLTKCGSNVVEVLIGRCSTEQLAAARAALLDTDGTLAAHCFGKHVMLSLRRKLTEAA